VADVVPKSIVYRLLAPTMELDEVLRISCREDKLERLLADLAIQRLDLVISDSPMPNHLTSRLQPEAGRVVAELLRHPDAGTISWKPFPACLQDAPLLVPGQETVVKQPPLLRWLGEQQVQPRIGGVR
jgi:LysR family transcriptional activator of nhaA